MIAFNKVTIVEHLALKIESVELWLDRLLVGTYEGLLLVFEVKRNPEKGGAPFIINLESSQTLSKRPITQLSVVMEHNMLVTLSDGILSVYDLPSFSLKATLQKAKGCILYALESRGTFVSLCASLKRKLIVFNLIGNQFVELKELVMPDTVRSLVWCDQMLCVGFRREYNMINIQSGGMTDVFQTGKSGNPIATRLPDEQLLLGRDNLSIFIGFDGRPTRKYGLTWSDNPVAVAYAFPYVIALLPKFLEVRTLTASNALIQTVPIKGAKIICSKDSTVYVVTSSDIWRLIPVPLPQQVEQLVADGEYEDALSLCDLLPAGEDKVEKTRQAKIRFAYHLFSQGNFKRTMEFFEETELDVLQVIGLYQTGTLNFLPRELRSKFSYPIDIPDLVGVARDKAFKALGQFLSQLRKKIIGDRVPSVTRMDLDYGKCTDVAVIVDTCLLKLFVHTSDSQALTGLLTVPNFCFIRESETALIQAQRFVELVEFYRGKKMHAKALELLANPNYPLTDPSHTISYLKVLGGEHINLILSHSPRVLADNKVESLVIFTHPRPSDDALPRDKVLAHLRDNHPMLAIPYLEHVVQQGERSSEFHNELVFQYLEHLQPLLSSLPPPEAGKPVGSEPGMTGQIRLKLLNFLKSSRFCKLVRSSFSAGAGEGFSGLFLAVDNTTDKAEKMLSRFPDTCLFEERAILLSRIGQHEQALSIYAHKLKNYVMAEEYCAQQYSEDKEEGRDIYLTLLQVYLRPQKDKGSAILLEPALKLLSSHYQRIDIPRAVKLLPTSTPINRLLPIFEPVLQDTSQKRRGSQVVKNLLKSENLMVREQQIFARSRVIKIDEGQICPMCSRALRTSVFVTYPNGQIVHYVCHKNANPGST